MNTPNYKEIAKNLRKPEGEYGQKIAEVMNKGNAYSYKKVMEHLDLKDSEKVLEIGVGNGINSKEVIESENIEYTGLDFSSDMIKIATANCVNDLTSQVVRFVVGDVHKMPLEDGFFDKVFTLNTVYFWDDAPKAASEIFRVLKHGGKLFLEMRNEEDMHLMSNITQHGFIIRSVESVVEILKNAGFNDVKVINYVDPEIELEGKPVNLHTNVIEAYK